MLSLSAASVVSIVLLWKWHALLVHDRDLGVGSLVSANIPLRSPEQTPASRSRRQQSFVPPRRQPNPQSCPAARPWCQHRRCATWLYHNQARALGCRDVTAQLSSRCGVNLLGACSAAQEWKYKYNDSGLVLSSWLEKLKQSSLSVKESAEEQLGAGE